MISFWYGCKKYDILKIHMRKKQTHTKTRKEAQKSVNDSKAQ